MHSLIAALLLPVPALAEVPTTMKRDCAVRQQIVPAAGARDGFRRLDRLPAASAYLTVYREVDRCPAPVVVRYGIGTSAR